MNITKIGVGVIVVKDGKVLVGKRKNSHGDGTYSFPGGHLEFGESFESCAKREVEEESSIVVTNIRLLNVTNDIFEKENKHYITVFMICEYHSGTPQVLEPDKLERWEWVNYDELKEPLFLPIQNLKNIYPKFNDLLRNKN